MSDAFSSVVNFFLVQFLRRVKKLSILSRINSENEIKTSTIKTPALRFPQHHKQMRKAVASATSSTTSPLAKVEIERIVASTFDEAFKLLDKTDVHNSLKKKTDSYI